MKLVADTERLANLIRKMKGSSGELDKILPGVINTVGRRWSTNVGREIVSQVRLSASYVRDKMTYRPATTSNPVSMIVARRRPTRLATYSSRQLVQSAPRAKGDPMRGIAAGQKQDGVIVGVKGQVARRKVASFFYVPLIRGDDKTSLGENGMGVFVRTGKERNQIKHLYGPSAHQVFLQIIPDITPEISWDLQDELRRRGMQEWVRSILL